jgi:hypothetical protein
MEYADYAPVRVFTDPRALVSVPVGNGISMLQCVTAGVLSKDTIHSLAARTADIKVKEIEFVISSRDQGWTSEGTEGTFNTSSWLEASIVRRAVGAEDGTNPQLSVQLPLSAYVHPGTYQPEALARGKTLVERPEEAGSGIQNGEGNLAWYLQGNRVASLGRFEKYRVAWRTNGYEGNEGAGNGVGFLETLREGDEVIVWARAKVSLADEIASKWLLTCTKYPGWSCVVSSVKVTVRYSFSERDSAAA